MCSASRVREGLPRGRSQAVGVFQVMNVSNTGGCLPTIRSHGTIVVPAVSPTNTWPSGGMYSRAAAPGANPSATAIAPTTPHFLKRTAAQLRTLRVLVNLKIDD